MAYVSAYNANVGTNYSTIKMVKLFHYIKGLSAFVLFIVIGCKDEEPIDMQSVFEKPSFRDSLSYYFPPILNDTITKKAEFKDFSQKWYSTTLYSFKEPILYNKSDSQTIYRLLWLRSFHQPICFTVKDYKGHFFLNAKVLDRQPAFYPTIEINGRDQISGKEIYDTIQQADHYAKMDFEVIKMISHRDWKKVEADINSVDFWHSSIYDIPPNAWPHDGSVLIIEGRKKGKYHFIIRVNPSEVLSGLMKFLINQSEMKISDKDIY